MFRGLPVFIELNPCILSSMGNDNFLFCLKCYHHTLNSTIKSDTFTKYIAYTRTILAIKTELHSKSLGPYWER